MDAVERRLLDGDQVLRILAELRVGAMAMRNDATLLTCSPDLYSRIPGLKMVECGNDLGESLRLC